MSATKNTHDADIVVVGSGHNGLVVAAYAAMAGCKVIVCEKREDIGGAVCTRDMFGGYKMDVGGSLHCLIHHTPIIQELNLAKYGLEYIEMDPILSVPLLNGRQFCIFRSLERTCQSIAHISERDAESYYQFIQKWRPLNMAVFDFFLQPPTALNFFKTVLQPSHGMNLLRRMAVLSELRLSYGEVIRRTFENKYIQGAMAWWAAQSGPPPHQKNGAEFFAWQSMLHEIGAFRPKGGSGMLTRALARCIQDHGGTIMTSAAVSEICTERNRVCGVRLESIEARAKSTEVITAPIVVANAHIKIVFEKLLQKWTPPRLKRRIAALNVGNGFGMVLRCATDTLPQYTADRSTNDMLTTGIQVLCPSISYLEDSYADFARGRPARNPAALAMTFSAIDRTLAPAGKHTLFIWGQYYPFTLRAGLRWEDIAYNEAQKLIAVVEQAAPGIESAIRECYIQSPLEIARLHSMPCANVMHLEMTIDTMFMRRPCRELRNYHTPLEGLFLANAGMHPGGGISGAAGYNCYAALLPFLERVHSI